MNVVYTAPNRAHHYRYALEMHKAGILNSFISGFSRFSPRAKLDELGPKLRRADFLQTVYVAGLKFGAPTGLSTYLAYLSKIEQDFACKRFIKGCDVFLFYNGSGLHSCQYAQRKGVVTVVEAVNSHVEYQEQILEEEYRLLNLPWIPFYKKEKERRIEEYKQADFILVPSEFVKKSFMQFGFSEKKLLKVPYGFDLSPLKKNDIYTREFTILYVGSISVRKGVRYLIEAFIKLKHPHKKLILVGPRSEHDGLQGLSIPSDVVFTGSLKGDKLMEAYRSADVFCLPSLEDGFGLVLGEALSFGVPVITTTNTGAYDILTEGKDGFIVPIRNADCISEKLQLLADDTELLKAMKTAALEKSKTINGWNNSGDLLTSTLSNLINR